MTTPDDTEPEAVESVPQHAVEDTPLDKPSDAESSTPEDTSRDEPNSEAAKRRRQLREAQTELATVRGQLTAYQRRHAEQIIAEVLATPADLFDVGHADLSDYIDADTGELRTNELLTAATSLVEQRPQLGASYTPPWPAHVDYGQGVRSQSAPAGATWSTVLTDQRRRHRHPQ